MIATRNFSTRSSTAKKEAAAANAASATQAGASLAPNNLIGGQESTDSAQSTATVVEDTVENRTANMHTANK